MWANGWLPMARACRPPNSLMTVNRAASRPPRGTDSTRLAARLAGLESRGAPVPMDEFLRLSLVGDGQRHIRHGNACRAIPIHRQRADRYAVAAAPRSRAHEPWG